jgi:hypothetical protein
VLQALAEQRLNHANVRAALKQMGREAVAKRMQRERFSHVLDHALTQRTDGFSVAHGEFHPE